MLPQLRFRIPVTPIGVAIGMIGDDRVHGAGEFVDWDTFSKPPAHRGRNRTEEHAGHRAQAFGKDAAPPTLGAGGAHALLGRLTHGQLLFELIPVDIVAHKA